MVKTTITALALLFILSTLCICAEENASGIEGSISVFGGLGISGAGGDYPSEYDSKGQFSFYPGLRMRLNGIITPQSLLLVDFGYLETGFKGHVSPTDSDFWNTYEYLNLNIMFGSGNGILYYAAGLYLGIGLDAYSYREYEDDWFSLDSNADFGLTAEAGIEPLPFLSLGIQGRYGLKSIGTSVDIKNRGILGTFALHFFRF